MNCKRKKYKSQWNIFKKKTITRSIAKPQLIKTPIPTPITKKPTYLPQMENNKIEDNITKKKKKD